MSENKSRDAQESAAFVFCLLFFSAATTTTNNNNLKIKKKTQAAVIELGQKPGQRGRI